MSRSIIILGDELPARFVEAAGAIPALGIYGDAIREAVATDYQQLGELLRGALRNLFKMAGDQDPWPYVKALYPDRVIIERDGKTWAYPYAHNESTNTVTLGQPVEVVAVYEPVGMRESRSGAFLEATGKPGRYRIRVIQAGLSGNGNFYPDAVLREAVPLFDGARVFVKGDEEHLAGKGKDFRNLIGGLSKPVFVEGKAPDTGEVQAIFTLLNANGPEAVKIREAWDSGLTNLFGFSIDAKGQARNETPAGGRPRRTATKFVEVSSVDLIVEPGAGGRVIGLVEAKKETIMDRAQLIALIEATRADLLRGKDVEKLTDEQLQGILREAMTPAAPATATATAPVALSADQVGEMLRMAEARSYARITIAASNLPATAKAKLAKRFGELTKFTEADVDAAITDERTYIASFTESGHVRMGGLPRIEVGETRAEKVATMFDAFFDPQHKEHRHARSFRECYVAVTGDDGCTGMLDNCDQALLRESLGSGSWANVLGNSITRRLIADYRTPNLYDAYKEIITTPVPIRDFRTNERTRYGGYGDLPIVAEGGPYVAQSSPTDEKATYQIQKRGGTEDVTLEMIANDDVGAIRQIPIKLGRAAKRTLAKFVLDFIRVNPTIYDGVALFHASHNNLLTAALDATGLSASRLNMLKQTELSSNDRTGIPPKGLMVPFDLQQTGFDLFKLNTNNEKTFIQSLNLFVLPIWYWTDITDWALYADPMDIPGIEIGFFNGNEEPEIFVQDAPTVGSMFSNDKLTYKLRHIYGGNVLDFRAFHKNVVAG